MHNSNKLYRLPFQKSTLRCYILHHSENDQRKIIPRMKNEKNWRTKGRRKQRQAEGWTDKWTSERRSRQKEGRHNHGALLNYCSFKRKLATAPAPENANKSQEPNNRNFYPAVAAEYVSYYSGVRGG